MAAPADSLLKQVNRANGAAPFRDKRWRRGNLARM